MKRFLSFCLTVLLLVGCLPTMMTASAAAPSVSYTFTGRDAARAGYGEGTITIAPENSTASGYYLLYFANDSGLLAGYDEFASLPITGNTVTYTVKEGTLLPPAATKLALFKSASKFLVTPPSLSQAVASVTIPSKKRLTLAEETFSFGAVSDVHVNYESLGYGAHQKWVNTLNFFAAQGMEKVIVTGDMTGDADSEPLADQYATYRRLSDASAFDYADIYEGLGNHGNTVEGRKQFVQYTGGPEEVHPSENSAWFSIMVEGKSAQDRDNLFLFMSQELSGPSMSDAIDNFSKEQIDWLEGMLKTYANTETNIFLIEHSPFLNYGPGDRYNGDYTRKVTFKEEYPQNMRLKGLIETYKNIIHLSGHTHLSLYDNENYATENNTSCRMMHVPSGCQPATYNNGNNKLGNGDGRQTVNASYGSEGYTVRVYNDYIIFTGHNITTGRVVPAACYILPTERTQTPDEAFEGAGTLADPYRIETAADFRALTNGFNSSTSTVKENMYGYGKYFLQTADIDMTAISGYNGTAATGDVKTYFAGIYNGAGHTLKVDIDADGMRSIFPYTYGTIANLRIVGSIRADEGAQPIRSLYGHAVNCLVDMELEAPWANGLLYSNYSFTYNVYTRGTLRGDTPDAFACSDYSTDQYNLYHWHTTANGAAVTDEKGIRSQDAAAIAAAFNDRSSSAYTTALDALGGFAIEPVTTQNGEVVFVSTTLAMGDIDGDGNVTTADARTVLQSSLNIVTLTSSQKLRADINGDGLINTADARDILKMSL